LSVPAKPQLTKPDTSHVDIRLASINLFNFIEPPQACYELDKIYSQEQWRRKQDWFARYLASAQPDLVGFQEVFSPDALAALAKAQGLEHFTIVDMPELVTDYIYRSPVVALASRYPIVDTVAVTPAASLAQSMGLAADFSFSRKVLRATVDIPAIGLCDIYVVHFKSMRPGLHPGEPLHLEDLHVGPRLLARQALGFWASSMQRGAEAALLFHAMLVRRQLTSHPMVLMGDFNDELYGGVLGALLTQGSDLHSQDVIQAGLGHLTPRTLEQLMGHYRLRDAYELWQESLCAGTGSQANGAPGARPATHYYGAHGSVLDYILLSNEFDAANDRSLAQVVDYEVSDRHLLRAEFKRDAYSTDHAPVMVTLRLRE
jgi:endonuclease/exonuclease/phosphatase family metal-dependent hydrolase